MYRLAEVRNLHLEITTACNAACPMCPRNMHGDRPNPHLPAAELRLEDVRTLLPTDFVRQLGSAFLCGNYGDPMVAQDNLPVLEHFRALNPNIHLGIHTNGSGRSPAWWRRLAGLVNYCRFGIDGLADTNAIYRRHTRWEKILESIRAFVGAGGRAEWDFIVFRHNEHQVEEARTLARELGFAAFHVKATSRFLSSSSGRRMERFPVVDREGREIGGLEPPVGARWQNRALARLDKLAAKDGAYAAYLDVVPIRCKVAVTRSLYMSAEGLVAPCCWLGSFYRWDDRDGSGSDFLARLPEGKASLDPRRHGLAAIVDGPVFQRMVPDGWLRGSIAERRLETCARTCGPEDLFGAQFFAERAAAEGA